MSLASLAAHLIRPTLTVSIPPRATSRLFEALLRLRVAADAPFVSLSALVVATIIKAAADLPTIIAGEEPEQ